MAIAIGIAVALYVLGYWFLLNLEHHYNQRIDPLYFAIALLWPMLAIAAMANSIGACCELIWKQLTTNPEARDD